MSSAVLWTLHLLLFSSVQSLSCVRLFVAPWTAAHQASLSITNSWSSLKQMSIDMAIPSNHLILYHPLLCPPSFLPSIKVLSNESVLCIRWPKYFSFSCSISLEKAMAPHSSTLAWKIPWMEEPGRLQSTGSLRVGHDFPFTFHFHALEKEMATHSSILACRIPWAEEPSGLQSMVSND